MNILVMFKIRLGTEKYVIFLREIFYNFQIFGEKKNEQMHNNIEKLI